MPKRRDPGLDLPPADPPAARSPDSPFAQLKGLRRDLVRARRAALIERAPVADTPQAVTAEVQRPPEPPFATLVGPVIPLKPDGRIVPDSNSAEPLPLQRWADDAAVMREALSDDYAAEWLLEADDTLSYRRPGLGLDVVYRLRQGHWTIHGQLDLHGLRVDEARDALGEFLRQCLKQGRRCVRVIHGKGLGSVDRIPVLKEKVRRWLVQRDEVLAFAEARPHDGGSGVVLVLLRRP